MAGLLRSWQRMGGLASRAVDSCGAAPAFSRSHRTIAYAAAEAAPTTVWAWPLAAALLHGLTEHWILPDDQHCFDTLACTIMHSKLTPMMISITSELAAAISRDTDTANSGQAGGAALETRK